MTDIKFGRNYRLTIDPADGGPPIVLGMPLTLRYTVERHTLSDLNNARLEIYNLSESERNRIFQDQYYIPRNKTVTLEIGYESLTTVFAGTIWEAHSSREGTDIVTAITGLDGNFDINTTQVFQTYTGGKTMGDLFKFLIGQFPNLQLGAIGDFGAAPLRPVALNGNVWSLIKKYSQNQCFIDLGKVFVLKYNEVVPGQIPDLSIDSGLLETPRRDDSFLTVTTLMEPRVAMMQNINLKSVIYPGYNAVYQVAGVLHQGTISAAVGGSARSTFSLLLGSRVFGGIKTVGQ